MSAEGYELFEKKSMMQSEDWWAVWLGLFIFLLGFGPVLGSDWLGWVVKQNVWVDLSKSLVPFSKAYAGTSGFTSAILTYLLLLAITTIGAAAMRAKVGRYVIGFTIIYWLTFICSIIGNNAFIAATPNARAGFKIPWSLSLGEMGLVFSMIVGLIIGNFFLGFARFLQEAAKPEWFIKTGIVILGASIGIKAVDALGLASTVIVRGLCAVVEAYLIYWPIVYFVSRKYFKFTPEWSAPLASGISICGVSAAIATGSAIRSRPHVPAILSAVIIVFVAVELLFLPWLASSMLVNEPMVAGSWMGLAVKSDGGAVASGAITDALLRGKALKELGINWQEGWILTTTTITKVFIDIFIGVWAFILAVVWSVFRIDKRAAANGEGSKVTAGEIWDRFPKFVIGFAITLIIAFIIGMNSDAGALTKLKAGADETNILRTLFFGLCFFSIGLVTNVRKLWGAGMGRIVGVYAVCLFCFILWVGLLISWLFYHGITPPVVGG